MIDMIIGVSWILLKVFGLLMFAVFAKLTYAYFMNQSICNRLAAQTGITNYPGNEKFPMGVAGDLGAQRDEDIKKAPQPTALIYGLNKLTEKTRVPGEPAYRADKHPMVVYNFGPFVTTFIADPEVIQDFYTTKQKYIDKDNLIKDHFGPMFDNIFGTLPANTEWKKQRKHISHMFYKERMRVMIGVFKEHLNQQTD